MKLVGGDWIRTNDPLHPMQVRYRLRYAPDPGLTITTAPVAVQAFDPGRASCGEAPMPGEESGIGA